MYFGWIFGEIISRSNKIIGIETGFSFLNNSAICLRIESLIAIDEGEKLNVAPGAVGIGLAQLSAQHNRAALIVRESQSSFF